MRAICVLLVGLFASLAVSQPCFRIVNGVYPPTADANLLIVHYMEGDDTTLIRDPNDFVPAEVSKYRISGAPRIQVFGSFNASDLPGELIADLTQDAYYSVVVHPDPSNPGEFTTEVVEDDNSRTSQDVARVSVRNYASTDVDVTFSSVNQADLTLTEEVQSFKPLAVMQAAAFGWEDVTSVIHHSVAETNNTRVTTNAFFQGNTYSVWFFGTSGNLRRVVEKDRSPGLILDSITPPVYIDPCTGILCPTGRVCRNGRCILDDTEEKCRDYLGFDVVEVARDMLNEIDGLIRKEINETLFNLKEMRQAVEEYDPTSNRLDLTSYIFALQSICHGRDTVNCSEQECRLLESGGKTESTCSLQQCAIAIDCMPMRELEFLQLTFLGAIAKIEQSHNRPIDACLRPFSIQNM